MEDKLPKQADVLIAGAGAGGAAAAWALARRGATVVLIDAGPGFDPADYKNSVDDWETQWFPIRPGSQGHHEVVAGQPLFEKWSEIRNISAPRQRMSTATQRKSRGYSHIRGIGGTTLHFTGWMHRLRPQAFEMNTRFGVAADWPVKYDELERYYALAEYMVGVAGPDQVAGRPRSAPFPTPAHPASMLSQAIARGAEKVGLSMVQNPVAAPSQAWLGRPPCNYCGCCHKGCERGDKGSADLTFVVPAKATGKCGVFPRHTLVELQRGDNDQITGATILDAAGDRHTITASNYVLAAGAVETPRLLLATDGLGNESGEVGKNFMETVGSGSTGMLPEQIGSHRGYPEDSICWDINAPDAIDGIPGGAVICPTVVSSDYHGPARYATKLAEGIGSDFKRKLAEDFGKAAGITVICENLPNPRSYVDLSPNQIDYTGLPIARIHSFLPDLEIERLAYAVKKSEEILFAAGVPAILDRFTSYEAFYASHVMGTCRMGSNPETSVVNEHQRSHRWKNLWVSDASVFPSSGSGEGPSLTLHALSIRMADKMLEQSKV